MHTKSYPKLMFPNNTINTEYCVFVANNQFICEWDEETYMELMPDVDNLSVKKYQNILRQVFLTTDFHVAHQEEIRNYHWFPKYTPCIHPEIQAVTPFEEPKSIRKTTIEHIRKYYELVLGCEVHVVYYTKQQTTSYLIHTKEES